MKEDVVRHVIRRALNKDGAIAGVVEVDGEIAGCLYLHFERQWYSDQVFLMEIFNFVLPQHRRSPCTKSLIHWAKTCSSLLEKPLMIGIISNHRTEAKIRLYRRQLGDPCGAYFIHNAHFAPAGEAAIAVG